MSRLPTNVTFQWRLQLLLAALTAEHIRLELSFPFSLVLDVRDAHTHERLKDAKAEESDQEEAPRSIHQSGLQLIGAMFSLQHHQTCLQTFPSDPFRPRGCWVWHEVANWTQSIKTTDGLEIPQMAAETPGNESGSKVEAAFYAVSLKKHQVPPVLAQSAQLPEIKLMKAQREHLFVATPAVKRLRTHGRALKGPK